VEQRRRDAGTEPERNDRHRTAGGKPADPSESYAARDERAFLRTEPARSKGHRADRQPGTGARKRVGHGGAKIDFPERNNFREFVMSVLAAYKKVKLFFALKTLCEIRVEFKNRPDDTA